MSEIVAEHLKNNDTIDIYDPTSGSGSLLINIGKSVAKHMKNPNNIKYYAQELKQNTYNLTRMNLVMRGILPDNITTRNADTLEDDWPYFDDSDPEIINADLSEVTQNHQSVKDFIENYKNDFGVLSSLLIVVPSEINVIISLLEEYKSALE